MHFFIIFYLIIDYNLDNYLNVKNMLNNFHHRFHIFNGLNNNHLHKHIDYSIK